MKYISVFLLEQPLIEDNLNARELEYEDYVKLMKSGITNGLDLTIMCMSSFLRQYICVVIHDHLWLSAKVDIDQCGIFLMFVEGRYNGVIKNNRFSLLVDYYKIREEILSTTDVSALLSQSAEEEKTKNLAEDKASTQEDSYSTDYPQQKEFDPILSAALGIKSESKVSGNASVGDLEVNQQLTADETPTTDYVNHDDDFETLKGLDNDSFVSKFEDDKMAESVTSQSDKWENVPMQTATALFTIGGSCQNDKNVASYLKMLGRDYFNVPGCNDHMFNSVRPQIMPQRSSKYTGKHMRYHIVKYFDENEERLKEKLQPLKKFRPTLSFEDWPTMMIERRTCGYEISLLILDDMFDIPILVLREDFIWTSREIVPFKCPIVLIMNRYGKFLGTKGHRAKVGKIPKVIIPRVVEVMGKIKVIWPKEHDDSIKHSAVSTPKITNGIDVEHPSMNISEDLSPIIEDSNEDIGQDAHVNTSSSFDVYNETIRNMPPKGPIAATKLVTSSKPKSKETEKNLSIKVGQPKDRDMNNNEEKREDIPTTHTEQKLNLQPTTDNEGESQENLSIYQPITDMIRHQDERDEEIAKQLKAAGEKSPGKALPTLNVTLDKLDVSSTITVESQKKDECKLIKFRCKLCGDLSVTKEGYQSHLFQAHKLRRVSMHPAEEVTTVKIETKVGDGSVECITYMCNLCKDQFEIRKELREHFHEVHGLFNRCPKFGVPCSICGECFFFDKGMSDHLE